MSSCHSRKDAALSKRKQDNTIKNDFNKHVLWSLGGLKFSKQDEHKNIK